MKLKKDLKKLIINLIVQKIMVKEIVGLLLLKLYRTWKIEETCLPLVKRPETFTILLFLMHLTKL
jgi:hypothetical protein